MRKQIKKVTDQPLGEFLENNSNEKSYSIRINILFKTFLNEYLKKPVNDILNCTPDQLLKLRNFGNKSYITLITIFYKHGVREIKKYPIAKYTGSDRYIRESLKQLSKA